jgi:hypothetical protein
VFINICCIRKIIITEKYIKCLALRLFMETITLPKEQFERMKNEIILLRNSVLYKRLLEFEKNIFTGKKYSREDLGF